MKYVIIGAGPAGVIAAEELRAQDASAEITIINKEPHAPYSRMAIPYLIKKQIDESGVEQRISGSHFEDKNITILNASVENIDIDSQTLNLSNASSIKYDKLLIASGGKPLTPPIKGIDLPGVHPCWTLDDARDIIKRAVPQAKIVLIGAGFISTTIVEALVECGGVLTIIEMEDRLIPRMMDAKGSEIIRKWCADKGVTILTSARVERIDEQANNLRISITDHDSVDADLVISATGVAPDITLLESSDIKTELGIIVNEFLETSVNNIYAAGDVAQAPDLLSKKNTVMAIQPVAAEHGRLAAINMVKGNTLTWSGSINMNVLDMLGLVSCSFGLWQGVKGGDSAELHKPEQNKYIQLQFDDDRLIGASSVGFTDHIGVFQGLIQGKVKLGEWKQVLMDDPSLIMKAWIGATHGTK